MLGWETGAEFLNWGHLPLSEIRNLAGPGRAGLIVPHILPTLSVRVCAGLAGPGRADSHSRGRSCALKMDRFRLSRYAFARTGLGADSHPRDRIAGICQWTDSDPLGTPLRGPARAGLSRLFITPLGAA